MEHNLQVTWAAVSDRGLSEKRPQNEDSYLDLGSRGIFAVADGVGGAQAGDVASQMAVEILGEAFVNLPENTDPEDMMRRAIESANSAIYQMSQELPQLATMATTIVALYLRDNIATIGHVGDSRLYRLGENGVLVQETADHSIIAEEVRAGRLTPEEAENHPNRNIISRALGAESTVEVELKTIMVGPGNSFLLCSDGITRHVTDREIEHFLTSADSPEAICERLKDVCYERGAEDNLTAVVVKTAAESASGNGHVVTPFVDETEEVTVASARPAVDRDFLEADTIEPNPPEAPVEPAVEEAVSEPAPSAAASTISLSPIDTALQRIDTSSAKTTEAKAPVPTATASAAEPENRSGGYSRALSALLFIVLGAAIGAAAYYFAFPTKISDTPPPQITEMKTQNIPLTAFEENRRAVDRNPGAYLTANGANPQDAEDFYLVGRAYLLTGKYWDAKQAFNEAKNRLASANQADAKTLSTEIAMALAIINNGPAQEAFAKDIAAQGTASNVNTNTNTGSNANVGSNAAPDATSDLMSNVNQ